MNERLKPLLEQYVIDSRMYHDEYHYGTFDTCEHISCRLAREIEMGRVSNETYQCIINGEQ